MKLKLPPAFYRRRWWALLMLILVSITSWRLLHQAAVSTSSSPVSPLDVRKKTTVATGTPQDTRNREGDGTKIQTDLQPSDIFAVRTWEPPPPAPVMDNKSAQNLPPQAPPLPLRFLGRIIEPDRGTAFLLIQGDRIISVHVGDLIDGIYRVDKYENGQLHFFYRPMKIRQSLMIGNDS